MWVHVAEWQAKLRTAISVYFPLLYFHSDCSTRGIMIIPTKTASAATRHLSIHSVPTRPCAGSRRVRTERSSTAVWTLLESAVCRIQRLMWAIARPTMIVYRSIVEGQTDHGAVNIHTAIYTWWLWPRTAAYSDRSMPSRDADTSCCNDAPIGYTSAILGG